VLNPEDIRNASFSLLPTGYSPEAVDIALDQVAAAVASGESITELVTNRSFEVTGVGFAPAEVDAFFGALLDESSDPSPREHEDVVVAAEQEAAATVGAEAPTENADGEADPGEPAAERDSEPQVKSEPEPDSEPEAEPVADGAPAAQSSVEERFAAGPASTWQPSEGVLDLELLCQAVDRTGETLASLRGFIDNEVGAMKLAVERQAHETAKRCEHLVAEALAEANRLTDVANAEIGRARKAADSAIERERGDLAKELKRLREECDASVAQKHADADDYAAKVRAEADKDRAEAQRTIENAIGMQASIAESLERARQQLTPAPAASDTSDDLAA
jgi:DivIVA domain-containing protein